MGIRRRLRAALRALELTEADAYAERRNRALVGFATMLEHHQIMGQLSVEAEQWAPFLRFAAPGYFYSPIPRMDELAADGERIWGARDGPLPGIDLRLPQQRALVEEIAVALAGEELPVTPTDGRRYYADNPAFGIGDATMLAGMLRVHRPARIVEIGSGYSSALVLDVTEEHLTDTEVVFVEPYTDLLRSLMREGDEQRCRIVPRRAQELPAEEIRRLGPNDVLFIDSTHVVRTGSDVCHIVLEVLPLVAPGVLVHFHDIFWPFELPRAWVEEGRQWAECYLVRAYLTDNPNWEIVLFNDFLATFEEQLVHDRLPQFLGNPGASLWLRRVEPASGAPPDALAAPADAVPRSR